MIEALMDRLIIAAEAEATMGPGQDVFAGLDARNNIGTTWTFVNCKLTSVDSSLDCRQWW